MIFWRGTAPTLLRGRLPNMPDSSGDQLLPRSHSIAAPGTSLTGPGHSRGWYTWRNRAPRIRAAGRENDLLASTQRARGLGPSGSRVGAEAARRVPRPTRWTTTLWGSWNAHDYRSLKTYLRQGVHHFRCVSPRRVEMTRRLLNVLSAGSGPGSRAAVSY